MANDRKWRWPWRPKHPDLSERDFRRETQAEFPSSDIPTKNSSEDVTPIQGGSKVGGKRIEDGVRISGTVKKALKERLHAEADKRDLDPSMLLGKCLEYGLDSLKPIEADPFVRPGDDQDRADTVTPKP